MTSYSFFNFTLRVFPALVVFVAILSGTTQLALGSEEGYEKGLAFYAQGKFADAVRLWEEEGSGGHVESQFNMGVAYYEGKGVVRNKQSAMMWFERAAKADHAQAQYNLGHLLLDKQEDLDKIGEGIDWWRQAAENGFMLAQYNYGRALFFGLAVEQDLALAHYWISQAARSGEGASQRFLEEQEEIFASLEGGDYEPLKLAEEPAAGAQEGSKKTVTSKDGTEARSLDVTVHGLSSVSEGIYAYETLGPVTRIDSGASESAKLVQMENGSSLEGGNDSIDLKDYVLVAKEKAFLHTENNHSAFVLAEIAPDMLLRVVDKKNNWLLVQVPGGTPGWVSSDAGILSDQLFEVTSSPAVVYARPNDRSENSEFGRLSYGTKLLFISKKDQWYRVMIPELVPVWIEGDFVRQVSAKASQIGAVWQEQRLHRKLQILADQRSEEAQSDQPSEGASKSALAESIESLKAQLGDYFKTGFNKLIPVKPEGAAQEVTNRNERPQEVKSNTEGSLDEPVASSNDSESRGDADIFAELGNLQGKQEAQLNRESGPFDSRIELVVGEETTDLSSVESDATGKTKTTGEVSFPSKEQTVLRGIYRITSVSATLVDAPYENAVVLANMDAGLLVSVVDVFDDWAKVIIPGGVPVWAEASQLVVDYDRVVVHENKVPVRATPGNELDDFVLGVLNIGLHTLLLDQQPGWVKLLSPESITAWMRRSHLLKMDDTDSGMMAVRREWDQQKRDRNPVLALD